MRDRSEWQRGEAGDFVLNGKPYKKLVEFKRPCLTCGGLFSIHVTERIASGAADSNSFGLKNCPEHRRNRSNGEVETLGMANNVMKEELDGLYTRNKELFAELQIVKARLATYELQPAMAAHADKMPWNQK